LDIVIFYDEVQLEKTVEFIATHNPSFIGQQEYIRTAILQSMDDLVSKYPGTQWLSTMGYYVWATIDEEEGIDSDQNLITIEFMVDPAVGANEHKYIKRDFYKKLT
jgi:hypothetical protein